MNVTPQRTILVREAELKDRSSLRQVLLAAFPGPEEADLVELMGDRGETILELVAEEDGQIVGFLCLCQLRSPGNCLGLAPVAVSPSFQRRGIGSALIEWAISYAKRNGIAGIFLVGDPNYYARFGFSVAAAKKFKSDYPPEFTQLLVLSPSEMRDVGDSLTYCSSFD